MPEQVKPPDVEALVIAYLNAEFAEPFSSEVPTSRPALFGRVVEVPFEGIRDVALYRALVSVECWGTSKPAAKDLALRVVASLHAATEFYVEAGSPGYLPDPVSSSPRYVLTAEVFARGGPV